MDGPNLLVALVGALLVAGAVLYAGYAAYEARLARERAARQAPTGPDPLDELRRTRTETAHLLADARGALERARDAVRHGTRGD